MRARIGGSTYPRRDLALELEDLRDAGYDFAELNLEEPLLPNADFQKTLGNVRDIIPISIGHLPEAYSSEGIQRCKGFIGILSRHGARLFIVHLFSSALPTEGNLQFKVSTLKELVALARDNESVLALENTEEGVETLSKIMNEVPDISFCLDVGHANLFSAHNRSIAFIEAFGNNLCHVHVHDNQGGNGESCDIHLPIGSGNIAFSPIIEKLKAVGYAGGYTLEIFNPDKGPRRDSIKRLRELL